MFRFHEKQPVILTQDYQEIGLPAGAEGTIWALYQTTPPSYEVTFRLPDGSDLDLTLGENEIVTRAGTNLYAASSRSEAVQ